NPIGTAAAVAIEASPKLAGVTQQDRIALRISRASLVDRGDRRFPLPGFIQDRLRIPAAGLTGPSSAHANEQSGRYKKPSKECLAFSGRALPQCATCGLAK